MNSVMYMGTVAPGLESVAEAEILAKLPGAWVQNRLRGRLLFGSPRPYSEVMQLRCLDNLYAHIAWFKIGPHKADLPAMQDRIAELDITPALQVQSLEIKRGTTRVFVSASRAGKHTYSRFAAAEAAQIALQRVHGFKSGNLTEHDIAFRLDIIDSDALFALKLTPPTFRFRGVSREFAPAALRPPVAHALIWASAPEQSDVFLDPFCGSGTIAAERAAYEVKRLIAADVSAELVAKAKKNLPEQAEVYCWDAQALPLPAASVTKIVTNPPWGRQVTPGEDISALYRAFIAETGRVLAAGGHALVLTDQIDPLQSACQQAGLAYEILHRVSLHGLLPAVYRIGRG